ncbi:MAG: hypothetical protein PHU23_10290 [Dehalococcoidales bacterium]|nr:hypothetical protein [Dehalococcoidales bacterium]
MMSNENSAPVETKIIITHKANKASIGIQQTNCDPVLFTIAGDMATAIARLPELIAEAGIRWQTNPRYPKAEVPEPPAPVTAAVASPKPNTATKPDNKQQEAMF